MKKFDFFEAASRLNDRFCGLIDVELWDMPLAKLLMAVFIVLVFFILRSFIATTFINRMRKLVLKTETQVDDKIVEAIEKPVSYFPFLIGLYIAGEYVGLAGSAGMIVEKMLGSAAIILLFWTFLNIIEPMTCVFERLHGVFDTSFVDWIVKAVKGAIVFIGIATTLELWGIKIGPIIAGLGLFGVAVALGAQDLFKNLISGILILAERRFTTGDWIHVEGLVEGVVEKIGFRSTLVRRFDKSPVYVPNAGLSDNSLTNFSAMTYRRICWTIGLEYRTRVDQLKKIRDDLETYLQESNEIVSPPDAPLFVRIDKFNNSSIDMLVYCFTHTTQWARWLEIKEELALTLVGIVEGAGAGFAFPSQSVYIETMPEDDPGLPLEKK